MKKRNVLLLFDLNNSTDGERLAGCLRFARNAPNWEVRVLSYPSAHFAADVRYHIGSWTPDAIIHSARHPNLTKLTRGRRTNFLIAAIDCTARHRSDAVVRVEIDDHEIGKCAAELLLRRGLRHFAYFFALGPRWSTDQKQHSNVRKEAFVSRLSKVSFSPVSYHHIRLGRNTKEDDVGQTANWLLSLPRPCGIMAYNDENAGHLRTACQHAGIAVPEHVSIISVDNYKYDCELFIPTLTSIQPDFEAAGFIAASELNKAFNLGRAHLPVLKTYGVKQIVERQSTLDTSGSGRIASVVCNYIRENITRPINIKAMAALFNISPRLLQMHFRKSIGRSMRTEIQEVRLRLLAERLTTMDIPIAETCFSCGFNTVTNAQILFKRRYGMSMSQFRKAKAASAVPSVIEEVTNSRNL